MQAALEAQRQEAEAVTGVAEANEQHAAVVLPLNAEPMNEVI
jgi:hypothetical protein